MAGRGGSRSKKTADFYIMYYMYEWILHTKKKILFRLTTDKKNEISYYLHTRLLDTDLTTTVPSEISSITDLSNTTVDSSGTTSSSTLKEEGMSKCSRYWIAVIHLK